MKIFTPNFNNKELKYNLTKKTSRYMRQLYLCDHNKFENLYEVLLIIEINKLMNKAFKLFINILP